MWPFIVIGLVGLLAIGKNSRRSSILRPENTDFQKAVTKALATIRKLESGNNYRAKNRYSSASGAYQFVDGTWNDYGGYEHAGDAPPGVQDERARKDVMVILAGHNYDFKWIPAVWYAGSGGAVKRNWNEIVGKNKLTIQQYVDKWMKEFWRL